MNASTLEIKLAYTAGLRDVVLSELRQYPIMHVLQEYGDAIFLDFIEDFSQLLGLRSVLRASIVSRSPQYNPLYLSRHKAVLGNIITRIIERNKEAFETFKITCAGSDSPQVRGIAEFIQQTYGLIEQEDADLKVHIIKIKDMWEIGAQISPRPLSVREYRVRNMQGAMDSTIAYAVNSLCGLDKAESYLNVFSGSATLLIEAGQCYPNLKQLVGFDNNKEFLSLAIQNIKTAGLIKRIQLKEKDIFDKPDLGVFDVITSDLPFGMSISKHEDLGKLYRCFVEYVEETLSRDGVLVVYTTERALFKKIISGSEFRVIDTVELQLVTTTNTKIRPKIFVCKRKNRIAS